MRFLPLPTGYPGSVLPRSHVCFAFTGCFTAPLHRAPRLRSFCRVVRLLRIRTLLLRCRTPDVVIILPRTCVPRAFCVLLPRRARLPRCVLRVACRVRSSPRLFGAVAVLFAFARIFAAHCRTTHCTARVACLPACRFYPLPTPRTPRACTRRLPAFPGCSCRVLPHRHPPRPRFRAAAAATHRRAPPPPVVPYGLFTTYHHVCRAVPRVHHLPAFTCLPR